jgi:DNA polymerase-3 subunit delta
MTEVELKAKLKDTKCGFYIFYGDNEYLKDYYASVLRKDVVSDQFNYSKFEGSDFNFEDIEGFLSTYSFGNERKMLEVVNPKITKWSEKELSSLASLINDDFEDTSVLFVYRKDEFESKLIPPAKAPAKPSAVYVLGEAMKKNCFFVEFPLSDTPKLINWINRHFEQAEISITPDAARHLIDFCGNDMYILKGEIEKLCAVCKTVSKKEIETYCCSNIEYQTFDLTEALSAGNIEKVKEIFINLKLKKADPLLIMGTLIKNFHDLLVAKEAKKEGVASAVLAKDFAMNPWVANKRMQSATSVSREYLQKAIFLCAECDKRLKSFSSDQYAHIELLLEKLIAK